MTCLLWFLKFLYQSWQVLTFAGILRIPCQTSFPIKWNEKYSCKENNNLPCLVHLEALECSMTWKVTYICELRNFNYTKSVLHYITHNSRDNSLCWKFTLPSVLKFIPHFQAYSKYYKTGKKLLRPYGGQSQNKRGRSTVMELARMM